MACDELEGDNCFLFALGNRFQDNGMQWLDGLNLNQSQTFLNIMLKYVGDTFNETERRIIARNLYTIQSEFIGVHSIPLEQLEAVDRFKRLSVHFESRSIFGESGARASTNRTSIDARTTIGASENESTGY
eukprot:792951_1